MIASANSRETKVLTTPFDIIVVGSGAAGLYAALCLPTHYRVGLITKDSVQTGASDWAQGGIAAAISPEDSPQFHEEDRRVNQRFLNFPIAENPMFSLAIAKQSHPSCYKSTSSKACPTWHSA